MNRLPTCDDVFERLTRGPFPAGDPAEMTIEAHLAVCHECRLLAEALRPAIGLFHEVCTGTNPPQPRLPEYRGRLPEAGVTDGRLHPVDRRSLGDRSVSTSVASSWSNVGWSVAVAAAFLLGMCAAGDWRWPPTNSGSDIARAASGRPNIGEPEWTALLAATRNPACLSGNGGAPRDSAPPITSRCCTECHSCRSSRDRRMDVARLQLACVFCHRS